MITALLFTAISLGLVCLVTADCRAHHQNPDDNDSPPDRVRRD